MGEGYAADGCAKHGISEMEMKIMIKKKAILLGDYTPAKWHPLEGVNQEIRDIFRDEMEVVCTGEYRTMGAENLKEFDLCVSYTDCWEEKLAPELVHGLLSFVSGGGGLLAIHNGISLQGGYELAQMLGAKFVGHPPYESLAYTVSTPVHPIMEGLEGFEMGEEPYRFVFDSFTEKTLLLEYRQGGKLWPAAWAAAFGRGRVVYLAPGHDVRSFQNPAFREIIVRSGRWAIAGQG